MWSWKRVHKSLLAMRSGERTVRRLYEAVGLNDREVQIVQAPFRSVSTTWFRQKVSPDFAGTGGVALAFVGVN